MIDARRAQTTPKVPQPTLFELREDHRPAGERTATERYREPSLFIALDTPAQQ